MMARRAAQAMRARGRRGGNEISPSKIDRRRAGNRNRLSSRLASYSYVIRLYWPCRPPPFRKLRNVWLGSRLSPEPEYCTVLYRM